MKKSTLIVTKMWRLISVPLNSTCKEICENEIKRHQEINNDINIKLTDKLKSQYRMLDVIDLLWSYGDISIDNFLKEKYHLKGFNLSITL
jgi:hypothetical protein